MAEQAELVPRHHRRPDDPPARAALDVREGGFYRRGGLGQPRDLRLAAGSRGRAHREGRFRSGLSFALHPALSVAWAIHRSAWKGCSPKFATRYTRKPGSNTLLTNHSFARCATHPSGSMLRSLPNKGTL